MRILYPSYYNRFKCIAERCRHSCCVGWEIYVDEKTLDRYRRLPDGAEIVEHIGGDGVIKSCEGRCPFLRDDGLCRLIANHGEEYISEICQRHPRFYHAIGERLEGGIGASCEEACRIILTSDDYDSFISVEEDCDPAEETSFDTLSARGRIYSILRGLPYREAISRIKAEYGLSHIRFTPELMSDAISELEYLNADHRRMMARWEGEGREELHPLFGRFFAYLVYRHVSVAAESEISSRVGFCLLLCAMLEGITAERGSDTEDAILVARMISEEIEYSLDNTDALIFEIESLI